MMYLSAAWQSMCITQNRDLIAKFANACTACGKRTSLQETVTVLRENIIGQLKWYNVLTRLFLILGWYNGQILHVLASSSAETATKPVSKAAVSKLENTALGQAALKVQSIMLRYTKRA